MKYRSVPGSILSCADRDPLIPAVYAASGESVLASIATATRIVILALSGGARAVTLTVPTTLPGRRSTSPTTRHNMGHALYKSVVAARIRGPRSTAGRHCDRYF
jgi:hypothetical protein